jgi:hypothetical protein
MRHVALPNMHDRHAFDVGVLVKTTHLISRTCDVHQCCSLSCLFATCSVRASALAGDLAGGLEGDGIMDLQHRLADGWRATVPMPAYGARPGSPAAAERQVTGSAQT